MEQNIQDQKIDLVDLLVRFKNALVRLWPLVLVLAIVLSGANYFWAKRSFTPMYEAKAIFTVDSGYDTEDIFTTGAYYDQYASQQLAAAFPQMLSMEMMRDLVVQRLPKGYITGVAHAQAVVDSNMLVLTVQDRNPQDAYDYLCAIIDCYPQVAIYVVDNPQVKIMSAPAVPLTPFNSFSGTDAAVKGMIIGIGLGLVAVIIAALLTRTIQDAEDLKVTVNLPILVTLPKVTQKKRRSGNGTLISAENDPNLAESLRALRVKLKKILKTADKNTILVTSTIAGEGKTTVSINTALALKRDGHKVILLDADLRSQSVAPTLGEPVVGNGLMNCLKDKNLDILTCVRKAENGLHFISGPSTDKRHYAINPKTMQQIVETLSAKYDYVVIDTAPCEIVSDTAALSRCADCVLYVVRQDYAQKSQILNAVTSLHNKDVKITGCVLNGVPQTYHSYGYNYGKYNKYSRYTRYGRYSRYSKYSKYTPDFEDDEE
jgi:capsular exopolysaccharide synthesis family protein